MDKIDGTRLNFQKVQNDWFDFKKIQAEEQLKITSTVLTKTLDVKVDLRKPEQQQSSYQNSKNPFQEVDDASNGFQKLLEYSVSSDSPMVHVQTDLDVEAIVSSMKNQFQMQSFSGKEFERLLSLLRKNPDNALIKNAIAEVLRAFSALQTAYAAQNTMEKAIDNLIVLLKNDDTFQIKIKKQGNLDNNTEKLFSNIITGSSLIPNQQKKYDTTSPGLKDLLQQIKGAAPEESSIYKTIDSILSAMKRIDDANRFDLNVAVEKLLNLPGQSQPDTSDKLTNLLQKALGTGNSDEKLGMNSSSQNEKLSNIAQNLIKKAQFPPEKNELEEALSVIDKLKKQYPQSSVVQTLSAQTLSGLTANLLANEPMLHFFLKSFLNDAPHVADVWVDPDYKEGNEKIVKVFLSVDLDNADRFEVELRLSGKMLSAKVLCPESFIEGMNDLKKSIREQANHLGFSVPNISVGVLSVKQELDEVFGKDSGGRRSFNARI